MYEYERIQQLISDCYEPYKVKMTAPEREICEENLYIHNEYEEALTNFLAILKKHHIVLTLKNVSKINEVKRLIGLD